jgi:hypothetical protein
VTEGKQRAIPIAIDTECACNKEGHRGSASLLALQCSEVEPERNESGTPGHSVTEKGSAAIGKAIPIVSHRISQATQRTNLWFGRSGGFAPFSLPFF